MGHRESKDAAMAPPQTDLNIIVESEPVEIVEGGDTQSEGTTQESTTDPPEGEQEQPMETNPPTSPVSPNEDDLLTRAAATAGVVEELVFLRVTSSPEGQGDNEEASSQETRH